MRKVMLHCMKSTSFFQGAVVCRTRGPIVRWAISPRGSAGNPGNPLAGRGVGPKAG